MVINYTIKTVLGYVIDFDLLAGRYLSDPTPSSFVLWFVRVTMKRFCDWMSRRKPGLSIIETRTCVQIFYLLSLKCR